MLKKGACSCGSKQEKKSALQELLHPANLFRFAAFTFSVIMSSGFMIKTLNLIFRFVTSIGGAK